jgi:hypothetical protein
MPFCDLRFVAEPAKLKEQIKNHSISYVKQIWDFFIF